MREFIIKVINDKISTYLLDNYPDDMSVLSNLLLHIQSAILECKFDLNFTDLCSIYMAGISEILNEEILFGSLDNSLKNLIRILANIDIQIPDFNITHIQIEKEILSKTLTMIDGTNIFDNCETWKYIPRDCNIVMTFDEHSLAKTYYTYRKNNWTLYDHRTVRVYDENTLESISLPRSLGNAACGQNITFMEHIYWKIFINTKTVLSSLNPYLLRTTKKCRKCIVDLCTYFSNNGKINTQYLDSLLCKYGHINV